MKRGAYINEDEFAASPIKISRIEEPKRGNPFLKGFWLLLNLLYISSFCFNKHSKQLTIGKPNTKQNNRIETKSV